MTHGGHELLCLTDVVVEFGGTRVLDGVTVAVPDHGITVIAGPSGSGKTTLLRLCNRLEVPTAGTVAFRGRPLDKLDPLGLRRRVGMVFQQPALFGGTVRDNLTVAEGAADRHAPALHRAGLDAGYLDRQADTLSGGEAQRVCLARTLVTAPVALLLDEPTSALDPTARIAFERAARDLAGDIPIVWVTHDAAQIARVADRVVLLDSGRVRACGHPGEVMNGRETRRFFTGTDGADDGEAHHGGR